MFRAHVESAGGGKKEGLKKEGLKKGGLVRRSGLYENVVEE